MFDRRFVWTGAAVALVAAVSFFVSRIPAKPEIAPITETVSGIEKQQETPSVEEFGYAYLLKELDGRVAVYPAGSLEPELVLDVLVKYLPDYDRSQMQQGIQVKDYKQLVSLIEDYTS